jgi:heat-inducible transcriptional repressor
MGYLEQPHTSAGRVPSDKAYRYYVDRMLQVPMLSKRELELITTYFDRRMNEVDDIIIRTAKVLSELTDYVSVAMKPAISPLTFKQVRLIPVAPGKVLAVIVTDEGLVKDLIVNFPQEIDERSLDVISMVLTENMYGKSSSELPKVLAEIREKMNFHEHIFRSLINSLGVSETSTLVRNIVFDGIQNMFKHQEYTNIEKAKNLLQTLETKELLYDVLEKSQSSGNMVISISIGSENEQEQLKDSSIVTASYCIGGKSAGSFGVIGPTRMNYARVIAILNQINKCLNEILSGNE